MQQYDALSFHSKTVTQSVSDFPKIKLGFSSLIRIRVSCEVHSSHFLLRVDTTHSQVYSFTGSKDTHPATEKRDQPGH